LRIFQNFSFWKIYFRFKGKTGLLDSFSKASFKTNRVLEEAHLLIINIIKIKLKKIGSFSKLLYKGGLV